MVEGMREQEGWGARARGWGEEIRGGKRGRLKSKTDGVKKREGWGEKVREMDLGSRRWVKK